MALRQIRIYDEIAAQVRRIRAAGIEPTHIDTHKHTHLAPPVLDAVARVAEESGIRWVRSPFDFPLNALGSAVPRVQRLARGAMGLLRGRFHRVLARHRCRTTDHFAGFQITGRFRTRELLELLALLPEGSTELMVHPGRYGPALRAAHTRLKESREAELEALVAPAARQALERHGIQLSDYRSLDLNSPSSPV
jgi:predicted glycoside hydrolase/deacetylase ChbG (UPF0249 family)